MPSQVIDQPVTTTFTRGGITSTYYRSGIRRERTWSNASPSWKSYSGKKPWELPIGTYSDVYWRVPMGPYGEQVNTHFSYPGGSDRIAWGYGPGWAQEYSWINSTYPKCTAGLASEAVLSNEALIRNLNKAADVKINMPVAAAEAKKTIDMILGTARRLDKAYRHFRKGNFVGVARELNITPGRVHKNWLEYKYGWMPLLMDVRGAAEAYAQKHFPRPPTFRIRTKAKSQKSGHTEDGGQYGWAGSGRATIVDTWASERVVKHDVWYQITNPQFSSAQQLGLTNPAVVAWELTPWSFVFDWFISVGDWLSALTACHGLTVLWSAKSILESDTFIRTISDPSYQDGSGITHGAFKTEGQWGLRWYQRSAFSVSSASIYPPVNRDPFGWNRMITGLALLKSQRR